MLYLVLVINPFFQDVFSKFIPDLMFCQQENNFLQGKVQIPHLFAQVRHFKNPPVPPPRYRFIRFGAIRV
mgnify:CR=1 FL=1